MDKSDGDEHAENRRRQTAINRIVRVESRLVNVCPEADEKTAHEVDQHHHGRKRVRVREEQREERT